MARVVYIAPLCAVQYIGKVAEEFRYSLARPKPVLEKGDVCVMEKKHAYNLAKQFPDKYKMISSASISFDTDESLSEHIEELEEQIEELELGLMEKELTSIESEDEAGAEETETESEDKVQIKRKEEFNENKDELDAYALTFKISLDKRKSFDNMYLNFLKQLASKGI